MSDPLTHFLASGLAGASVYSILQNSLNTQPKNRKKCNLARSAVIFACRFAFFGLTGGNGMDLDHVWVLLEKGLPITYFNLGTYAGHPFHGLFFLVSLAVFYLTGLIYLTVIHLKLKKTSLIIRYIFLIITGVFTAVSMHMFFDFIFYCIFGTCRFILN